MHRMPDMKISASTPLASPDLHQLFRIRGAWKPSSSCHLLQVIMSFCPVSKFCAPNAISAEFKRNRPNHRPTICTGKVKRRIRPSKNQKLHRYCNFFSRSVTVKEIVVTMFLHCNALQHRMIHFPAFIAFVFPVPSNFRWQLLS